MDYWQIARDLIAIESITGGEEPVVEYLESHLRRSGFDVRSQAVEEGRRNIVAGPAEPKLLFCTHTDTVPPYIPLSEDNEFIYGRGACDTKGITACFLEAGRRLKAEGIDDFGYLFVVGEEIDNCGARKANVDVRADYIIIGEPTENKLVLGHKGFLGIRVIVEGTACHSAYPERGDSATHRLLRGLERVLSTDFGSSEILGPATVNVGKLSGGVAANVLAPSAEATLCVRVVTNLDEAESKLRQCFADPETRGPDPLVRFEIVTKMSPTKFHDLEGFRTEVVSYGTDAPFLSDVAKPLLYGPGSILDAHTDGEKISKKAMDLAVDDYVRMAKELINV